MHLADLLPSLTINLRNRSLTSCALDAASMPPIVRCLIAPNMGGLAGSVLMNEDGRVWQLVRGGELLAELVVTGGDFPWLNAQVRPAPGFAEVRPLFQEELRLLDQLDDDPGAWETAYRRIRQTVCLLAPHGRAVPEFLLHIDGDDAWWRWSDEPFSEAGP